MLKNYLKTAIRHIEKYKTISLINIFGLAIGMACCILIFLWIQDEFRFDRFHENKNKIHQVYSEIKYDDGRTRVFTGSFYPLAKLLKEEIPEVVDAIRYETATNILVSYGENSMNNNTVGMADASFFTFFSFPFVKGNGATAIEDRYSIVITEQMAQRYFGDEDPMGKVLNVHGQFDLKVTGVIKDVPHHSSFQFDCVIPFVWLFGSSGKEPTHWGGNPPKTFILVNKNAELSTVVTKINSLYKKHNPTDKKQVDFFHHPLTKYHLFSPQGGGLIQSILIFSIIAIFVLGIACINFMNLSTARSASRFNEVGLRKVVGAKKSDLIRQFFGESILLSFLSLIFAFLLLSLMLGTFNRLMGKQLSMDLLFQPTIILGVIGIAFITGILSGSYPALFLSSLRPINVMKRINQYGSRSSGFRKSLVVIQFALSIFLIIGSVVIYKQMHFVQYKDLGYEQENVLCMGMVGSLEKQFELVKHELLGNPNITSITRSMQHPTNISSSVSALDWEGKNPNESTSMNFEYVDYDYFKTLGMEIIDGRSFSREHSTDFAEGYIVNEEAVRLMGINSPVGKRLSVFKKEGRIIGVVKNFHFQPLHEPIRPFVIGANQNWGRNWMFIKLRPIQLTQTLEYIKNICKKFDADYSFMNFHFLDSALDYQYRSEKQISEFAGYFTLFAILISCLGLFGLANFMAQQRKKEIGIRKILGASELNMVVKLSADLVKWVLISNIIAWPIGWYIAKKWLENFAYRINIDWWTFLLAGTSTLVIALLTVSYQAIKTAIANPIESLRYE